MAHPLKFNPHTFTTNDTSNLSYLSSMCDGDKTFMQEMIQAFIHDMPKTLWNLRKKLEEQDWNEVEKIAHKMKPATQFVGLNITVDILRNIEHNSKYRQDLEQIPDLINMVSANIQHAVLELQIKLDNHLEENS